MWVSQERIVQTNDEDDDGGDDEKSATRRNVERWKDTE
jgi:hypothetical protein